VLQVDVPELKDRACLSQDSSLTGIGEEVHQRPWQSMVQCQPPYGGYV
jgi:hypothetical protein